MALHLVTGGSGFVGSNIARLLIERGESVRVLDLWYDSSLPSGVDFIKADVTDRASVKKAMSDVQYVHHTVALVPLTKAGQRFQEVNVDGSRIALEEAIRAGVRMFSNISSSAIYGSPDTMPITRQTPLAPIEIYGRAKRDADLLVLKALDEGYPVATIRPRTIVGPGRLGIFEILFDWIRDGADIFIIGKGNNLFQFVHNDDLCSVSIECCVQEKPGVYNVGAETFGTLRDDLTSLIKYSGSRSKVRSLPVKATIQILRTLDYLKLSPLGPWHYLTYHKPFYFDISEVKQKLGWSPRFSNNDILKSSYDWFVQNGNQTLAGTSMHKKPVKQGVLSILKMIASR